MKITICKVCGKAVPVMGKNFLIQMTKDSENAVCYDCYRMLRKHVQTLKNCDYPLEEFSSTARFMMNMEGIPGQEEKATPSKIKAYLDKYIVGQDAAKRAISTAIYNQQMLAAKKQAGCSGFEDIQKSNILMVGPSGSGKTAMLKRLAKVLKIPFVIEDITGYSSTGFVGKDIDVMLQHLLAEAGGDVKAAERGIIYIDEFDKCASKGDNAHTTADPSHQDLQSCILKLLEGSVVDVCESGMRHHPHAKTFKIDTENILFIVGGAFAGIDEIIKKRLGAGKAKLGFMAVDTSDDKSSDMDVLSHVCTEDFKRYGIMPEVLGRVPVICSLNPLSERDLERILVEPKDSVYRQYQGIFALSNARLIMERSALREVVRRAVKRRVGARSLRGIMEEALEPVMFALPDHAEDGPKIIHVGFKAGVFCYSFKEVCEATVG